ncbi:hypothetical protein QYF61_019593 [Mycteria americana]|uniref:Uncharacterized protein n=1 Tax=Mycteria americana TaxID=33587 RepID=A0AAN7PKD6_MYCAM|nr:hypothetical protein QYF61_019593 [Mycteria americana]
MEKKKLSSEGHLIATCRAIGSAPTSSEQIWGSQEAQVQVAQCRMGLHQDIAAVFLPFLGHSQRAQQKYLIQTSFKYLQGWRLNHFPGQSVPMLDNPLGEEKFPNIQSKPPLAQLEAISSCPITCYLGEETDPHLSTTSFQAVVESDEVSPQPPFLQAKQSQLPQPLLIRLLLQTLHQLRCPSLYALQYLNIPLVVGGPKLNTGFEVRPHQCRVQGHNHFPSPAGHAIFDTGQDAIGLLGRLGTLLAHIQAAVNQIYSINSNTPRVYYPREYFEMLSEQIKRLKASKSSSSRKVQQTPGLELLVSSTGDSPRAQTVTEDNNCNSPCAWTILVQTCKPSTVGGALASQPWRKRFKRTHKILKVELTVSAQSQSSQS